MRCFPNKKPWITCDIKGLLNQKKAAFREGDRETCRLIQQKLRRTLKQAKEDYRKKVERKLQHNNTREVWQGMKTITGCKQRNSQVIAADLAKANEINLFFNRFNSAASACLVPAAQVSPAPPSPLQLQPPPSHSSYSNIITAVPSSPLLPSPPSPTVEEVKTELKRLFTAAQDLCRPTG